MVYEVGYSPLAQPCSRFKCHEGGTILKGQLQFAALVKENKMEFIRCRHLACTGSGAKRSVPRKHPSGQGLPGYYSLTSEDKARVNEFFGWAKEVESELQSNSAFPEAYSTATSPNVGGKDIPESSTQEPPALRAWGATPLFGPKERRPSFKPRNTSSLSDKHNQVQLGIPHTEEPNSLYEQLSSPYLPPARSTGGIGVLSNEQRDWTVDSTTGLRRDRRPHDDISIMQLELEEQEARAALANAELEVAKSQAKLEAARHAVIEQRLKMARASILHGDPEVVVQVV